ncbi:MAG: hypothetical protein ABI742_07150, partial [Gemmatimonadota bacterium]
MVTPNLRSRRGGSTSGCLISLVIFVAAVYYGIHLGQPWMRYYQLIDEMRVSARLAPTLSDGVIQRRLEQKVDELGLPPEAKKFHITRSGKPRKIVITTEYSETVVVPLLTHTFIF